jgi:DNA-binding CsgD family transcriptional regulator
VSVRIGSHDRHTAGTVVGRQAELAAVDAVLAAARDGLAALVLEGEPGIGKTTVWREGIARARCQGYRVLSCRAAPAEARLSFAALSDLLAPIEGAAFESLPVPQRRALDAALLRAEPQGAAPDPRAIGTGVVSLVSELSAEAPVLLALDDVQWLDLPSARTLEFALRRVERGSVAVLATIRTPEPASRPSVVSVIADDRIHSLGLGPLSLDALNRIVEEHLGRRLPRPLLVKIEIATGGNPFYALEIARAVNAANVTSGHALPVPDDLRDLVGSRLRRLPRLTRDALLRVSALAVPTVDLVDPKDLSAAEEAGVARIRPDGRIEFAHPLFAGAIYAAASHARRRRLHQDLANSVSDVEERARHLTLAAEGTDGSIAAVLEEAAEHAHRRGAPEVAAELEEQAARRTPADVIEKRWERCLRAGRHHLKAGDLKRARELAEEVLSATPPSRLRAQALHVIAEFCFANKLDDAIHFLEEALSCAGDDCGYAAQLEIALAVVLVATLEPARADPHLGRAIELARIAGETPLLAEATALSALARLFTGHGVDDEALQQALALEDADRAVPFQMRPSLNVAQVYEFTGRLDRARELFVALCERVTARGEETDLPWILVHLAVTSWLAGNLAVAEDEADAALQAATLTGQDIFVAFALLLRSMVRAIRGDSDRAREDGIAALGISERIAWAVGVSQSRYGLGYLALSESNPQVAVTTLEPVVASIEALGLYEWPTAMALPDAIEAFVATGELDRALRLTDALAACGRKFDRPWALATSGRCRALVEAAAGHVEKACAAAEQAIVDHQRLSMPLELGRTLLVLGQLQRRRGERRTARETIQRALAIFDGLGAPLWADRARAEIRRIGIRRAPQQLTEGEQRVAELAGRGLTNYDIAAALFLSRRTVEANLARAYRKLGIGSRAELGAVMAERKAALVQARP